MCVLTLTLRVQCDSISAPENFRHTEFTSRVDRSDTCNTKGLQRPWPPKPIVLIPTDLSGPRWSLIRVKDEIFNCRFFSNLRTNPYPHRTPKTTKQQQKQKIRVGSLFVLFCFVVGPSCDFVSWSLRLHLNTGNGTTVNGSILSQKMIFLVFKNLKHVQGRFKIKTVRDQWTKGRSAD